MPQHARSGQADDPTVSPVEVRERILATASDLFYRRGVRAVGVDLVVDAAGVAKTSLYRHFRTKDDLVAAFLRREDENFWACWDQAAQGHEAEARAELEAQLKWIGERVGRPGYRGCPQINVAAEFPDIDHPARAVAVAHKTELRRRLRGIAERLPAKHPDDLALKLSLLINGAFVSAQVFSDGEATPALLTMARTLVAADADAAG